MMERRDVFRICQRLPISDAERNRRPAAETPARRFVKFYRSSARSRNLAYAAASPTCAAAADPAATAATHSTATATAAATTTTATPANNNDGELHHVAASDFLIGEIERGETDVGHFLFAKNEALIGRDVVDGGKSAVGIVSADALPPSESPSPAVPSAVAATALVVRACFEACFTLGMVASFVVVRST